MSQNRPTVSYDANFVPTQEAAIDESFRGDYLAGTNLIYKGMARPGGTETDFVWQIAKLAYDGNNNLLSIKWAQNANGVAANDYIFQWSNRTAYTYS